VLAQPVSAIVGPLAAAEAAAPAGGVVEPGPPAGVSVPVSDTSLTSFGKTEAMPLRSVAQSTLCAARVETACTLAARSEANCV
jgi:hypothetical protein